MNNNTFVVTVNKDGQYNTKYYSEEDYNTKVIPFLSEHYTPDQYSVAGLQDTTADNIKEDGQYLVSVNTNGATQRKSYTGKELLGGKLAIIGQRFPEYSLQYIDGAVRPAEGSDDVIAVPVQAQVNAHLDQMKRNIGGMMESFNQTISDMTNKSMADLLTEGNTLEEQTKRLIARDLYKPVYGADENGQMGIVGYEMRSAEELQQYHEELKAAREEAKQESANQKDLDRINAELKAVNDQLAEWAEHENNVEDYWGENNQWIWKNAERKNALVKRQQELVQEQAANPIYQRENKRIGSNADKILNEAQSHISPDNFHDVEGLLVPNDHEVTVWQSADYFANQAKKTLAAPDKTESGFEIFLKGHADTFTDADFWTFGLNSLSAYGGTKAVFDKIAETVGKDYSDENLSRLYDEGYFDTILTDAEKALILSFASAGEAQALRALNTSNAYNAGMTSANSLAFVAQFILTGGIGNAFAAGVKGATKVAAKAAAEGLAKWMAKKMGKKGVAMAVDAMLLAESGLGRGVVKGLSALATPALKSIPMTMMQTGFGTEYAKLLTQRDPNTGELLYDYNTAMLPAFRNAYTEVWTESALEPVLALFGEYIGTGLKAVAGESKVAAYMSTRLDNIADFLNKNEYAKILKEGGWDNYFTEIGEEILAAGVSSAWDEDAWSSFWEKDNLVTMAVAFAPMAVLGGGMSMVNYTKKELAYDEAAPAVQEMLARRTKMSPDLIRQLFNREVNTMQDVADKISGIVNPIIESGKITADEFKALYDFADITAQKEITNALVRRYEQDTRTVMRSEMDQRMNGKQYISKDAEGNETISFYTDDNGNRRFVVMDPENTDGLCVSTDENGKDLKIVNVNDLEVTTMSANEFFDNMWKATQATREKERMSQEAAQQRQSVVEALKSGKPVPMFNAQTNQDENYIFLGWNGQNAVMANAQTGVEEEKTVQELANALNIDSVVLTDSQKEQAQIDESRKNDSIARSANDYKGAPVSFNGVSGTLLRVTARGDESGDSSLTANVITANGKLVPVAVTASDLESFVQERKDLAASGNAEAVDRRTRDHERKAQQQKESEAYRSSKEKYTNPDGSVREGEFLEHDPRGFAMYSDSKYGKADTDATLNAALTRAQTNAQQALQAKNTEANPEVKKDLRTAYDRAVATLDVLDNLISERSQDESSKGSLAPAAARDKYMEFEQLGLTDQEIYDLGMKSIAEAQERIAALPRPEVSTDIPAYMEQKKKYAEAVAAEQKKIDYWRSVLGAPMTENEKKNPARANTRMQRRVADILAEKAATKDAGTLARLDKELKDVAEGFIGQAIADINDDKTPVVITTADSVERDMRAAGSTQKAIDDVLYAIKEGYEPQGIFDPASGNIFFFADFNTDVEEARITFIHERQHRRTRANGLIDVLLQRMGIAGMSEEEQKAALIPELRKLVNTRFYDSKTAREIADEIISYSVEKEFTGELDSLGVNEIITNFAKNIDNERGNTEGISEPGRNDNGTGSYRVTDQGNGRAQSSESGAVEGEGSGSVEGSEETVGLTAKTQQELADKGLVMDGGVVMTADLSALKQETGYLTPNEISPEADAVAFSIRTKKAWETNYRKYPDSEERVIRALENLAERMAADELVSGVISQGNYKYGKKANGSFAGPLRTNIEYVVTFDMDTTCPRTFQYLNYVKQIEKKIGRPLTQTECIQLTEMMRMYGQQIPCVYCYSENKRQAMKQYYTDFMAARQGVLNAATEEEALEKMYGHGTSKAARESKDPAVALNKAAYKVFQVWRANRATAYNPSLKMLWYQYTNDRNVVLTVLDDLFAQGRIMTDLNDDTIAAVVATDLRVVDQQAVKVIEDIVSEWKWDAIEGREHSDFTPVDEDDLVVDPRTLSLWREMTAYAKSASQAKSVLRYIPYTDELKKLSEEQKAYINGMGGLRMHSSNDFRIDYVFDYFQFMADMAANHMFGHTYTKSPEFVRIFGNSGYKINMSIAAYEDEKGKIRMNEDEGFNWDEAKRLREAFPNAGVMLMATSDNQIQMALDEEWIDMFIPFHASSLPKAVWYNMRMWQDYSTVQNEAFLNGDEMKAALIADGVQLPAKIKAAEVEQMYLEHFKIKSIIGTTGKKKGKRLRPHFLPGPTVVDGQYVPGHNNDHQRYLELCREYGVHPRFYGIKVKDNTPEGNGRIVDISEHPNYIKCIKETSRTDSPQTEIQFNFDQPSEALNGKTPMEYAFDELQARAAAEMQSAGAPVRDIYKSLEKDTFGIVPQFIDTIIKHKNETGKDYPIDYITPDSRKWFLTERKALEEAYKDIETIPYHRNEYDIDGEPVMARVSEFTPEEQDEIQRAIDFVTGNKPQADVDTVSYRVLTRENATEADDQFALDQFENGETVEVYRSMQVVEIDGQKYALPPMAAKIDGKWVHGLKINDDGTLEPTILKSDEHPELADSTGHFKLDKGNGKTVPAVYNPYWHVAFGMLNDQFAEAQDRPNLITVKGRIPNFVLDRKSGEQHRNEKAHDPEGERAWKPGIITGELTGRRGVVLSRYFQGVEIVPDAEVAKNIFDQINGKIDTMPTNVVPPAVRSELEKLGVKFVKTDNTNKLTDGEHAGDQYTWWYGKNQEKNRYKGFSERAKKEGITLQSWLEKEGRTGQIPEDKVKKRDENWKKRNSKSPSVSFRVNNDNQQIFISNAMQAVEGLNMNKATGANWIKAIQGRGGLKVGEDKWLGLSDWLKSKDGSVTKQEVLGYIQENQIQIDEVKYYGSANLQFMDEKYPGFSDAFFEDTDMGGDPYLNVKNYEAAEKLYEAFGKDFDMTYDVEDADDIDFLDLGNAMLQENSANAPKSADQTRLEYTTRGLEHKREIALTVPTIQPYNEDDRIHFGDAGEGRAVAWIRFGETHFDDSFEDANDKWERFMNEKSAKYGVPRGNELMAKLTPEEEAERKQLWDELTSKNPYVYEKSAPTSGKRVLVIDEIQSKRHQDGREKGYRGELTDIEKELAEFRKSMTEKYNSDDQLDWNMTDEEAAEFHRISEEYIKQSVNPNLVPDAPFSKNWHELAFKRMLRLAAEEGYDKIAWTNGAMQAERYSLSKVIDGISLEEATDTQRTYSLDGFGNHMTIVTDQDGNVIFDSETGYVGPLSNLVGKELAEKMQTMTKGEDNDYIEVDSSIGGEGMKGFYDDILVKFANKYGKKWRSRVEDLYLAGLENEEGWHSMDITPEMKKSVMEGQVMFRTSEQREKLFQDAKNEFGTTKDFREAGYLLPDGAMLDFSEKNNGGEPGRRGADHRDIARVINDRSYDTMTEYLDDFINEGAIRLIPESGAFSIAQQPTKEQKSALRNFIYRYNGEVEVEIYKDGHSVADPFYKKRTSPTRVLNDIDAYFNEGVIPEGNEPMFRAVEINPETRAEMEQIEAIARVNGTYLKAPNGMDTKLNPEQWTLVRTKNFKNWFGDWINDPENASKVVDPETGEPMVVYHAGGFASRGESSYTADEGEMHFGTKQAAMDRFKYKLNEYFGTTVDTLLSEGMYYWDLPGFQDTKRGDFVEGDIYLDLKKELTLYPTKEEAERAGWNALATMYPSASDMIQDFLEGRIGEAAKREMGFGLTPVFLNIRNLERTDDHGDEWKGLLRSYPEMDGFVYKNEYEDEGSDSYIIRHPNQIKSATDNNGNFSGDDNDIRFSVKDKKKAPETVSPQDEDQPTVVSSAAGAKILNNLDEAIERLKNSSNRSNTFIGDLARDLEAKRHGSLSEYASFETVNGKIVTIRLSNHSAKVSNFDNRDESEGISIVISAQPYTGIIKDGNAHVEEYYYNAIKIRRSENKPLVQIVESIKQALYSGSYQDKTGLAETDEANPLYRITPEMDQAYSDAVEVGDMQLAQSLVDAAAESAMADSQVRDKNGKLLPVYHGTRAEQKFWIFDTNNDRSEDKGNVGSHFGPKGTADEFSSENQYKVYLNLTKVWETFDFFADIWNNAYLDALIGLRSVCQTQKAHDIFDRIYDVYPILATYDLDNLDILSEFDNDEGLEEFEIRDTRLGKTRGHKFGPYSEHRNAMVQIMRDMMKAEGYDGISYENWYEGEENNMCYVALYPEQIKSADAVTYDSDGKMIPLSERFNNDNPDIRFRVSEENSIFDSNEAKEILNDLRDGVFEKTSSQNDRGAMGTEVAGETDPESDGEILFRFIGEGAADRLDNSDGGRRILDLHEAQKYYTPESAENVKRSYGWELDKDANGNPVWKYEEPDFGINDLADLKDGAKVSDIVTDENLFTAYPSLKNYSIKLVGDRGYFDESNKLIAVSANDSKEEQRLTLIHEIQHFIQTKEGWTRGASEDDQEIVDAVKDAMPYIRQDMWMFLKSFAKNVFSKSAKKEAASNYKFFVDKWGFNPIGFALELKKQDRLAYESYMRNAGEVEARNSAKRADMTALERRRSLASETEDRPRSRQWRNRPFEDVMFRIGPAAEMKKEGIANYLDSDQMTDFTNRMLMGVFSAEELAKINEAVIENGGSYEDIILEHLASIAEKPEVEGHDADVVEVARKKLVELIGAKDEDLTANDVLWVAYDYVHGDDTDIYDRMHDQRVKISLDQAKPVAAGMSLSDYLDAAAKAKDDIMIQYQAMRELANQLTSIMDAMAARRDYDRATVGRIVQLSNDVLTSGLLDDLTNGEIKRLIGTIRKTTGMRNVQARVNELYNLILSNNLRKLKGLFERELKKKAVKVNNSNVVEQGSLDLNGQRVMTALKENLDSFTVTESGSISISQALSDKIADALERTASDDLEESRNAQMELMGLSYARQYIENVVASEKEEQALRDAMKEADEKLKKGEMDARSHSQFVKEQTKALAECRTERVESFADLIQKMQVLTAASHDLALQFLEREKSRVAQIHHDANSDMQGVPSDEHPKKPTFLQRLSNNPFTQFFFRPLATFDQMLRFFGNKSVNGEGYLWNRFMRGWIDATGNEYKNVQDAFQILDDKASEVFGRKMRWSDIYDIESRMPKAEVTFWDGGVKKTHELTQGNLLYIMLADQMTDGRMKLRAMGIDEEDIAAIRSQMDQRFLDLAEWIVNEFLPSRREAYNAVHERMFGAPMSKVQNYFPLKILSNARTQQLDVASANADPSTPSTVTGSIMKRTRNALALDVMGTDAFSLVVEHVQKMEHWAAFAEWNRDLSDLLSYKRFRNQVQNMTSIYGSQNNLWSEFVDTAMIAAGSYKGKSGKLDPAFNRIAKGVTAAKISLRVFTAIKQFLSFPAYFSEANPIYLAEGFVKGWNWSMDNLPMFEKRWKSRQAGDHILAEGNLGKLNEAFARVGMFPNALVDAFTVSIGSYAIYKTKYNKYVKMGFAPEVADRKAKQDAVILYNETQQSSEAAFMSSMQSGRSTLEKMFTVFRNSSMGYQRQVHDALRNYKRRLTPGYKAESIEYMTKQLIREGLSEGQAMKAAKGMFARQGFKDATRLMIFGYGLQFFWNLAPYLPYLLFGDDDDKKKEMLGDAAMKGIFGSVEGLTGGNLMSEAGYLIASGEGLEDWDPSLLPLVSDMESMYQGFKKDQIKGINDLVNLGIQMAVGVNPQTLEDAIVAIVDACNGDLGTAKEAMLLGLRIINAPQTSLDQLYLDEIEMSAMEAKGLTIQELAERYAKYKKMKGAGVMTPLYSLSPDLDQKVKDKYLNSFNNKVKERLAGPEADDMYAALADQAKEMDNRVKELRKRAKEGDEAAEKELMEIFLSPDYGTMLRFNELSKDVKAAINNALVAPTREEMVSSLDEAEALRSNIVDEFSGSPSMDIWFKSKYTQYTKGLLPEMARLEKEYSDEFAKNNPKYKEWMEQHQEDLDNAAQKAKANADRVAEIDAELKKYEIVLPNGKKKYINKPARKKLQDEKKQLRAEGTTEKTYLNRLKKQEGYSAEDFMPAAIYNSPEFQAYLEVKSLGSASGNTFSFKAISEWETKMKEAEDPETKEKYRKKIEERMVILGQQITRKLNGLDDPDDEISDEL